MLIGVPKEIKNHEYRVGLTPESVKELVKAGHQVIIETKAGEGIGASDSSYLAVGANIAIRAEEVFDVANMIVKVKEPQPEECEQLSDNQILFTYLHLAPDKQQTDLLLASNAVCIAYETVTNEQGGLPLLAPMSEVAGRLATQAGAHCLEKAQAGMGKLLGGVPGVASANVAVIGGGVVGTNAAYIANGMGAKVTILDKSVNRLRELDQLFNGQVECLYATSSAIEQTAVISDLVIGAVLVAGHKAPKLISREVVANMRSGAVLVDVAIDQGGCFETSSPTTHDKPTFIVDNIVHYCVANMPGAAPLTASYALNNATLPFILKLANLGYKKALAEDVHLRQGLNVCEGKVTHPAVAEAHDYRYTEPLSVL